MGKKYKNVAGKVEKRPYPFSKAAEMVKEFHFVKFDESVDLAIRLGVDPKHSDQMVRGSVVLPHGTGKKVRILVFAVGEKEKEAVAAGADFVGLNDYIEKINGGWLGFDTVVATPDLMGTVGKLGKVLGPRGLMPNPKTGTVTFDVVRAIKEIRHGKVEYRVDKSGIVHVAIGKASFAATQLVENGISIFDSIAKVRPASVKGKYIRSITLSSTMGPGILIDPTSLPIASFA